jgi:hypothetical protein
LYESVVRDLLGALVEKPSYAQLIAWTCQDHPDEVRDELQRQVMADGRAPRGRRIASDSVPLTPRFQSAELALLDEVAAEFAGSGKVTRTAAVIAVLRVAVRQGVNVSA